MDIVTLVGGIICFLSGIFLFNIAKKRIDSDELNYSTIRGYGVSLLLAISGFVMIALELSKIV